MSTLAKSTPMASHLKLVKEKESISNIKIVKKGLAINSLIPNFSYKNHLGEEVIPQQLYIY
jgi:hypothetical protein